MTRVGSQHHSIKKIIIIIIISLFIFCAYHIAWALLNSSSFEFTPKHQTPTHPHILLPLPLSLHYQPNFVCYLQFHYNTSKTVIIFFNT